MWRADSWVTTGKASGANESGYLRGYYHLWGGDPDVSSTSSYQMKVRYRNIYEDNDIGVEFTDRECAETMAKIMTRRFPLRRVGVLKITYRETQDAHK